MNDEVVVNEPVSIFWVFKAKDAVSAYEALLAFSANEALATEPDWETVTLNELPSNLVNVIVVSTADAVTIALGTNDDVVANDALVALLANEAVPAKEPLNEPVTPFNTFILPLTSNEPVNSCWLLGYNDNFVFKFESLPPANNWTGKLETFPICKWLPVEYK